MLAMFDRIKSIFFPVNSHKRKSTDPLDTLNENNSFYENSSKTNLKLNNENQNHTRELTVYDSIFKPNNRSSTVFKDNSSVVLNCNIKKIRVDNCHITQYVHNDCKSPNNKISRIDSVDFKSNESKYINNNNNKKISDFQSNPELTALTVKSKSHLLSSNFISNLTKPSIHSDSRQRRLQRLQIESSVNNEEIKKYDGSYIEDITDYFRELCYIPPLVFPRLSKKVVLPKITDEMRNMVNCSIVNRNRDMVVVEEFNLSITVTDLISLQPRQWLTDNIINFYLELIYFRNNSNNQYPSVQILTTFFYPKLRSSGYSGVKRWTKKRPVFDSQLVLIPIHLGNHWCLVSIDMCNQEVHYYDSLKGRNPECLELMKEFLVEDSKDKLKKQISISEWTFKQIYDGPTQHNGYDCGVFLSQTAEYLSRRSKLDFNQDQMQYFREKMSFEILNKQLLSSMSSEVANPIENQPAEQNNANQPRNNFWSMMKGFIFRMMVIYFISSLFRRQPVTETPNGVRSPIAALAGINLYQKGTWFDLYVYTSDMYTFNDFSNNGSLFWHLKNIEYGDWTAGPNHDGSFETFGNINPSENLKNNGSFYLHIYIVPSGHSPDPQNKNYDKKLTIYKNKMVTKHKKRKLRRTTNLLTGETDTPNELKANKSMESHLPPVTHWHPNMTIHMLDDHTSWTPGSVPPPLNEMVEFYSSTSEYYPVVFLNDYWNLAQDYMVVNETVTELPLNLVFSPISLFKLQLYVAQSMRSKWYGGMFGESMMQESDEEQDTLKKTMLDTNPYLLGMTVIVSIVHSVFEFLAFKNDIQFWRNRESLEGLSVRSVFFNVFQSVIVVLYVLDNDTNFMVKVSVVLGLLIEIWKIKKVINITVNREQPIFGIFPRITFSHKSSYTESDTKKYDQLAFKYLSWILFPLLVGYAIYSLLYLEHTGWYSWVLSMSYGFLLMFGFIMMTPQLFINYKMKSVAHLPWRKLTYKALNTFIDDIFAFVIKMPTLYRIGCLRDDVIFFIYLYQRWIYPIDPKRPNEYGVSQEMIEKYEAEKSVNNNINNNEEDDDNGSEDIPNGQASIECAPETPSATECDESKKTK